MSPGAKAVWGLRRFKNDKETALCLVLGRGSVTKFFPELQGHSALCLQPRSGAKEKLKESASFLHLTGTSLVSHRNQRNFRGSQRKEKKQQESGQKPKSFTWLRCWGLLLFYGFSNLHDKA